MLRYCLALSLLSAAAMADTIVYQEDFANFKPPVTKGICEVVPVTDHPEIKQALRLVTTAGGNKATPSWSIHTFGNAIRDTNPEIVTVDYWFKAVTLSARYMLFVHDSHSVQMVGLLNSSGTLTPNNNGSWSGHSNIDINKWLHVRYVIRSTTRSYDIYIDDMTKPRVANWRFRYPNTTYPGGLWIEGSETEPSETLIANVKVSVVPLTNFAYNDWLKKQTDSARAVADALTQKLNSFPGTLENQLARRKDVLLQKLAEQKAALAKATTAEEILPAGHILKSIEPEADALAADIKKYTDLFAPGKPWEQTGWMLFHENSTVKVMPGNYYGSARATATEELHLAQGETGAFQAVALTAPDRAATQADFTVIPQNSIAKSMSLKLFLIQDVATRMPNKPSVAFPDILQPISGHVNFQTPQTLIRFWADITVPQGTVGQARFSVTVTLDNGKQSSLSFPVTVEAYPFELPKEFSLSTAFCFGPGWGNAFYGKPAPAEKRRAILDFILDHRLDPMNLWTGSNAFLSEDEIRYCLSRGMKNIYLPIIAASKNKENMAKNLKPIDRNGWRSRVVTFGFDEILLCHPEKLQDMKDAFDNTKVNFPDIPRLNTAAIDKRLYGYVDIWCPLFFHYNAQNAAERQKLGEHVWWYPTDYPLAPSANFNLDSPGIDPRIIPWVTYRLNITGILYWGLNREWQTNAEEHKRVTDEDRKIRSMDWLTPEVAQEMANGKRWPDVPWTPFFRNIFSKTAKPSSTNGGGNLMYPGPDWTPWPSTRLKNLRDGLQDTEYFHLLKARLDAYSKRPGANQDLIKEATEALTVPAEICTRINNYTKDATPLFAHKQKLAQLIIKLQ